MKLSPHSEAIVKATAGVVAEHAVDITKVFYADMFDAHPELLRVFNKANQAIGEQPQALAASVVAYAVNLIDPNAPDFGPIMRRIAHKHVSLGIQAQEYTIVAHHLLKAVGTVLGDAVTPEIADAWDEVYWLFGCALIAEEARLYAKGKTDPEHPWRDYTVIARSEETDDVFSLTLRPDHGKLPKHKTGQYVAIAVDLPNGERQPRQYTISNAPGDRALRVTIKRVAGRNGAPDGQVSNWLGDHAHVGTRLQLSQPSGDMVLGDSDDPLILVSAGIGITPMASIIEDLFYRQPNRDVRFLHANKSHEDTALYRNIRAQVDQMGAVIGQFWYEEHAETAPTIHPARDGFMDLSDIDIPTNGHAFMCGPLEFMRQARLALIAKGMHPERISYEVFGPDLWAQNPN